MGYYHGVEWKLIPNKKPVVRKYCSQCGKKTAFINTEKFRVNANKKRVDVWLIYHCSFCKTTWNLSIYERVHPQQIVAQEYEGLLVNDPKWVSFYSYETSLYQRNKVALMIDSTEIQIEVRPLGPCQIPDAHEILLTCCHPIQIRLDRVLARQLQLTRNQVKDLWEQGLLFGLPGKNPGKRMVTDGMRLFLKAGAIQSPFIQGKPDGDT